MLRPVARGGQVFKGVSASCSGSEASVVEYESEDPSPHVMGTDPTYACTSSRRPVGEPFGVVQRRRAVGGDKAGEVGDPRPMV